MYAYYTCISIDELGEELCDGALRLGLSLKSGSTFKFQDCYCSFSMIKRKNKELGNYN